MSKPEVVVTRKHLWGKGTLDERLYIDIHIPQIGLTLTNNVIKKRDSVFSIFGKSVTRLDPRLHEVELPLAPARQARYGQPIEGSETFQALVIEAANKAPLTIARARKTAPPPDELARLERARKRGKVPVSFTLFRDETAHFVHLVHHNIGRRPAWRWMDPVTRRNHIQYFFGSEAEAAKASSFLNDACCPACDAEVEAAMELAGMKEAS